MAKVHTTYRSFGHHAPGGCDGAGPACSRRWGVGANADGHRSRLRGLWTIFALARGRYIIYDSAFAVDHVLDGLAPHQPDRLSVIDGEVHGLARGGGGLVHHVNVGVERHALICGSGIWSR